MVSLHQSPSVWREWIEICGIAISEKATSSPSVWREWIEIMKSWWVSVILMVSLRVEGVD